ncbi:unnamed protein product [Sympodiomycopsis kandeliae]
MNSAPHHLGAQAAEHASDPQASTFQQGTPAYAHSDQGTSEDAGSHNKIEVAEHRDVEKNANVSINDMNSDAAKKNTDVFGGAEGEGAVNFKTLEWPGAAVIAAKLQIGIGVIGLPGTFDTLGFFPGLLSLILLCIITTYTGILAGKIRLHYPEIHSPAELGGVLFRGNRIAIELFGIAYWILLVMVASSAILTCSIALNALSTHAVCTLVFSAAIVVASLLIGGGFRQLSKIAWLGWIGVTCVILAIWILTIAMLTKDFPLTELGQVGAVSHPAVKETRFADAAAAVTTQLFACLATATFYSISAEMREPRDFTKAVCAGQGFVIANYIIISCIVYAKAGQFIASPALGSAGPLFKKICYGFALPAVLVSAIIYSHMAAKQMFVRILRGTRHLTKNTPTHWGVWGGSYVIALAIAFILAAAIPIFDDLLSVIGATVGSLFCIIVGGWVCLFLLALDEDKAADNVNPTSSWMVRSYGAAFKSPRASLYRKWQFAVGWFLVIAGLFLLVGATYGSIVQIVDAYNTGEVSQAFSCADNSNSV